MRFEFSPHIAFQVKDYEAAKVFYEQVMGMRLVRAGEDETEFRCGPITFYVEPGEQRAVFFEFKTDDLAAASSALLKAGCRLEGTLTPEGEGSYFVHDPFGMVFHLWQETQSD